MTSGMKNIRNFKLDNRDNLKLHIFVDTSSVEIFVNDGEMVISNRIYPKKDSSKINIVCDDKITFHNITGYKLGGIKYEK